MYCAHKISLTKYADFFFKVAELVAEVRSKAKVLDKLRKLLAELEMRQQTLRSAGQTRWDSTGYMLKSVANARDALVTCQEEEVIAKTPDLSDRSVRNALKQLCV